MAYLLITLLRNFNNTVINNTGFFANMVSDGGEFKSEERLIPTVRALVAQRLAVQGFQVKEIAAALRVSQPAIAQYLKGKRGKKSLTLRHIEGIVDPLADKVAKRIRSGAGFLETAELVDTARQLMVINERGKQQQIAQSRSFPEADTNEQSLKLLRERLQLELKAAEKYLELANMTSDEHTKLLLRLIASDSIKHGDIVAQVMSWLEIGGGLNSKFNVPDDSLLEQMISLEDSAVEVNLRKSVRTAHPIARLLLEWIDMDEEKHEKMVTRILRLNK